MIVGKVLLFFLSMEVREERGLWENESGALVSVECVA